MYKKWMQGPAVFVTTSMLLLFAGTAVGQATGARREAAQPVSREGNAVAQIVTPVELSFDNPDDFDNFAGGRFALNVLLRNTLSGQTIRLDSNVLRENFRPSEDRRRIVINVVIDNLAAPLGDWERCINTGLSAENTADNSGVDITLTYASCGTAPVREAQPAQRTAGTPVTRQSPASRPASGDRTYGPGRPHYGNIQAAPGAPIGGIVVKGGRNPGGNLRIVAGDSRIMDPREAVTGQAQARNVIVISSSKGTGSPKANGF
jgi:hypothetical protein